MFFNRIPIETLKICNSNAMNLGKKFLAAIYCDCELRKHVLLAGLCDFFSSSIFLDIGFNLKTSLTKPLSQNVQMMLDLRRVYLLVIR